MNNPFVRNSGHIDNAIDLGGLEGHGVVVRAPGQQQRSLSPCDRKELAEKVTKVHLRALGAALNILTQEQGLRADELDEKVAKLHVLISSPLLRNKQFLYVSRFKALLAWALPLLSCKFLSTVLLLDRHTSWLFTLTFFRTVNKHVPLVLVYKVLEKPCVV